MTITSKISGFFQKNKNKMGLYNRGPTTPVAPGMAPAGGFSPRPDPRLAGVTPPAPTPTTMNLPSRGAPIPANQTIGPTPQGIPGQSGGFTKTATGWQPTSNVINPNAMPEGPINHQAFRDIQQIKAQNQLEFSQAIEQIKTSPAEEEYPALPLGGLGPVGALNIGGKMAQGAAAGFTAGAIAGGGVASPIAAPAGAVIGGIGYGLYGLTQIGQDAIQRVKEADNNRKLATKNVDNIINRAEAGYYRDNPELAAQEFRRQEIILRQVEATLKRESSGLFGADLSKSKDELSRIRDYFDYDSINYKMALINGMSNPSGKVRVIAPESMEEKNG